MLAYTWPWATTWIIAAITAVTAGICIGVGFARWVRDREYSMGRMIGLVVGGSVLLIGAIAILWSGLANINEQKKTARGLGDGPRPAESVIDGRPVDGVTEMADNFPNVATKCVWDGWRVFVTSNGDHLFVVPDADCRHKGTGPSD